MSKDEIFARIAEVIADTFGLEPSQIRPDSHLFRELDLDSLDAIDLVVGLEGETGVDVKEEELRTIWIVQDVVDLVHRKLEER